MTTRTVEFLKATYVVSGTVDAPEGAIFLDTLNSTQLVELINLLISNLDLGNRTKKVENKSKGIARATDLLLKYEAAFAEEDDVEEAEAPVTAEVVVDYPAPTGDCDEQAAEKREALVAPTGKVRDGSKQAALVDLLKRPEGASINEIVAIMNWVNHTARGAISRDVKKRLGYTVTTSKVEGRGRVYRIES